jgi:hypothetical protein
MTVINTGPTWAATQTDDVTPVHFLTDAEIAAGNYRLLEREAWYMRAMGAMVTPALLAAEAAIRAAADIALGNSIATVAGDLATHEALANNPHNVTATQVGAYSTSESDALFGSVLTSFIYYVDATGGSNNNDGLSAAGAWQTLGKVGTELAANTIKPGDRVLFKRGETWTGESLIVGRGGLVDYPIIFGAYGEGAKPIFDGNDVANCIIATSKSFLTFANLDCRNGYTSGAVFTTCTNITVLHCDMSGAGNDNLIFISNCQNCVAIGGTYADAYRRDAGYFATGIEITDGGDNFLIADVTCTNNRDAGITVHNHGAGDPQGLTAVPTNVRIVNATCNANLGNGINCMVQGASAAADIIIENPVCNNNVGTGIRIHRAGAGVGAAYWDGATITTPTTLTNTGYGMWIEADNITVDNWLSTSNQGLNLKDSVNFVCNNFTCYSNPASAQWPVFVTGARMNGSTFRNGIIYQAYSGGQVFGYAANSMTGADVDYMMFYFPNYTTQARWMWSGSALTYANWLATSGQNANGIQTVTNPLFVSVPSDLTLQAGSPAIDAGVDVGLPYTGPAPDLGYAERA